MRAGAGFLEGFSALPSAKEEMEALWRSVFGQPPPIEADAAMLREILVRHLPAAPPYVAAPVASPETADEASDNQAPDDSGVMLS